ncbi:olfactory receptor 6X1-like [Bombina bombina]|uniref:olfactory receptor 6X1-like n=1 Tax=Bombina bombina TaxID=8345 RepID=UPI00235AE196|nr:olfactory receptor 6X1-like [Bombina bombina]
MYNSSRHFFLLEFHEPRILQNLIFSLILLTYIMTLSGNFLIIVLIWKSHNLHTPMYFFLVNLSFLEIWFTTSIAPRFLSILAFGSITVSFWSCLTQCYFYFFLGSVEFFVLTIMSFDRYIAICYPLHYTTLMNRGLCIQLALCSWVGGFLETVVPTILVSQLPFCGSNRINHFFCDVDQLLKLACADTKFIELLNLLISSVIIFVSLICIIVSYTKIITTISKIPSRGGRWRSFSTCVSHLILVSLFYGASLCMSLKSIKGTTMNFNKLATVLNTIVTPLLNPFIYTLRNNQVKNALRRLMGGKISNA